MPAARAPENGGWRHPWHRFLGRGVGCFALGGALAGIAGWTDTAWLGWIGFGLALIGMWMLAIAWGEARRGRGDAWWRWYRAAYERNVRAAEHGSTAEPSPPQTADDR